MNDGSTRVQKTASLHERAVQAVARGEVVQPPTRRRRAAQNRSEAVHTHIQVHPLVMREAKLLTMLGSYSRIEIIDAETVLVR